MNRVIPTVVTIALVATACVTAKTDQGEHTDEVVDATLEGTWVGYRANAGGDWETVELTITHHAGDTVNGSFVFGDEPPPSDAPQADVGYPEGVGYRVPIQGLTYAMEATWTEGEARLQGEFSATQPWLEWCALQDSYPFLDEYSCLPNCGHSFGGPECELLECDLPEYASLEGPIDCGKLELCIQEFVCACSEDSCTASEQPVDFEFHLDGESLEGSVSSFGNQIYLTRQ